MSKTDPGPDSYSKNKNKNTSFPFYETFFINMFNPYVRFLSSSMQFNGELLNAFAEAWRTYISTIFEYNKSWNDYTQLDKTLRSKFHKIFNEKFREERFVNTISDIVASYSELAKITGLGKIYQYVSNRMAEWNNDFIEPIRDTLYRTPSHKICELEKYTLFRYNRPNSCTSTEKDNGIAVTQASPVLIIYAFINRHYILDLLPEVSVVKNLLNQRGLDIFATDWGTPSAYDKSLTIDHFVNRYIDKSVDFIRKISKSDKISLFGYCWGGYLALIYSALHPEKVKNLVTIA